MHQCNYVQEKDKFVGYKHEGFKQRLKNQISII